MITLLGPTRMNRIVKVISFPGNFDQDRYYGSILNLDKREPIQLEAEDGSLSTLPAISCEDKLKVGCWYEMTSSAQLCFRDTDFTIKRIRTTRHNQKTFTLGQ